MFRITCSTHLVLSLGIVENRDLHREEYQMLIMFMLETAFRARLSGLSSIC